MVEYFEVEYLDKTYRYTLSQVSPTLVIGQIWNISDDTEEDEIKEFLAKCIEAEKFFAGLELLVSTMGLQRESARIPRTDFDTDYQYQVYRERPFDDYITFKIILRDQRKEISVAKVKNMIENVNNYLKIKDFTAMLGSLFLQSQHQN